MFGDQDFGDCVYNDSADIYSIGWTIHTRSSLRLILGFLKYSFLFIKTKPKAVFSFTIGPNLIVGVASWFFQFRFIPTISGLGFAFRKKAKSRFGLIFLMRLILKNAKLVFFHNETDRRYFIRMKIVKAEQARVVNGSGLNSFERRALEKLSAFRSDGLYKRRDSLNVIMVARLIYAKGLEDFLDICNACIGRSIKFTLVGSYNQRSSDSISIELFNQIVNHPSIDFLGYRSDMLSVLQNADCMLVCSRREGLSKAVIEGLASGLPVIGYRVPGVKDVVFDGVNGFLSNPNNVKSMIGKIIMFSQIDKEAYRLMSAEAGNSINDSFAAETIFREYMSLLD